MTTQILTRLTDGFRPGDRISIAGVPNRYRSYVVAVVQDSMDIGHYVRPSRGYARHVRRNKAKLNT